MKVEEIMSTCVHSKRLVYVPSVYSEFVSEGPAAGDVQSI